MNGAISITTSTGTSVGNCEINECSFLSIQLVSFKAKCENKTIKLDWSTASETNNNYFLIERSIDAITWQVAAKVEGALNSLRNTYYTYNDLNNSAALLYYRLKQTDVDGQFNYSPIIDVKNCAEDDTEISVYPNPAYEILNIIVNQPDVKIVSVAIYNILGEVVYYTEKYQSQIVFENKVSGVYFLHVNLPSKTIIKKFLTLN
jgi:hypothetical protein